MDERFKEVIELLHPSLQRLLEMNPIQNGELPKEMPTCGIYMFSDGRDHLYVGRSNHLKNRYKQHTLRGSQHNQAVFAFKLARESTGNKIPVYVSGSGTRADLSKNKDFAAAFTEAKNKVKSMNYRFVKESDQTRQALLELYCAIALKCRYNDFDTH